MKSRIERLCLVVILSFLASGAAVFGQPPASQPFAPTWSRTAGPVIVVVDAHPPQGQPASNVSDAYEAFAAAIGDVPAPTGPYLQTCPCQTQDCNGTLLNGDPMLEGSEGTRAGWFTGLDVSLMKPHITNKVIGAVPFVGFATIVTVPQPSLDWTVSPRVEIGYRLPQGAGEVVFAYRFLSTDGNRELAGPVGFATTQLDSRLDFNVFDLDYATGQHGLAPGWDMNWRIGARLATLFFDDRADVLAFERHLSNHFIGAGPHVGLDLWRCWGGYGLMLFGRAEGSALIGRVSQSFDEASLLGTRFVTAAASRQDASQTVPTLTVQAGVSWVPPISDNRMRVSFGYQFDRWWSVGKLNASSADLTGQGLFFRVECGF